MIKESNFSLKFLIFFILSIYFFIISENSFAHPILPIEFMDYLDNNPYATQEDINIFMEDTYGTLLIENILIPSDDELYDENYRKKSNQTLQKLETLNESNSLFKNAKDFMVLGIEHIIFGFDHVLFVLSLVLVISSYREIFTMVSIFTIAHSLTFILAGTQFLSISSKIVEPMIAFSIAYVAITSVFFQHINFLNNKYNKFVVIFIFGLFHGLGFAGVFSDLFIPIDQYIFSLLFFNIGIELGQILILILILPLLIVFKKKNENLYTIFIGILTGFISALAIFWIIQRIFF